MHQLFLRKNQEPKLMTNHAKGLSETQALISIVVIPANTKLCHA